MIEPGHPCTSSSGRASGSGERAWTRWMRCPSTAVVSWSKALILASWARQSKLVDPVRDQLPEVGQIGALIPVRPVDGVREPGATEPVAQVVEDAVGHVDAERLEAQHEGERSDVSTVRPGWCVGLTRGAAGGEGSCQRNGDGVCARRCRDEEGT